jgi:hypothetical protein
MIIASCLALVLVLRAEQFRNGFRGRYGRHRQRDRLRVRFTPGSCAADLAGQHLGGRRDGAHYQLLRAAPAPRTAAVTIRGAYHPVRGTRPRHLPVRSRTFQKQKQKRRIEKSRVRLAYTNETDAFCQDRLGTNDKKTHFAKTGSGRTFEKLD